MRSRSHHTRSDVAETPRDVIVTLLL